MSERDNASQRSGSSASGNSETSSQRSDQKFLKKRAQGLQNSDGDEADVLEQKRNVQEGIFACMHTLVKQTAMSHWKFAVLRVVLEFLMNFLVAFNPTMVEWHIDTSFPIWQVVRWLAWRVPIARSHGYETYVSVMYLMAALVLLAVLGLAWLTLAMRKQEQSKALRVAALFLNIVYEVMFVMCYVSFFDYFTFMADCDFFGDKKHMYFDVVCTSMPHLLHMLVALAAGLLFFCVTALVMVASSDLNPASHGLLASPAAYVRLKILIAKAAFIIFANCLDSHAKIQAVGILLSVTFIVYYNFREMPFYRKATNIVWTGLWAGIMYPCVLMVIMMFHKNADVTYRQMMTQNVLYGIFPVILGGMAITAVYVWWAMRPARKFLSLPPGTKLTKVHKFESVYEVERLARVMRVFDGDGVVDPERAALGETIIKAGLQAFPNAPHLLLLYANFKLEVHKDGPAGRTQLQLVLKQLPNLVERYQVFCTNEASKRLKDSQEEGMDLQAYIEFKRNFRAVLRVHKEVLILQTELWQMCMRSSLRVAQFDKALDELEAASARGNQVYKRVLERYPNNGKLLRCYGKFLEDVRHDMVAASRAYAGANRNGGTNALLSLDLSNGAHGDKPDFLTSMSMEDDAVIVIDAEGKILMVSQVVQRIFGYAKAELEGANVSLLMPQPFSQRHAGYLQRYVATGEAHILDTVAEVVALHKERYVFPAALCVTRLSGVGSDSIFLGVVRPVGLSVTSLRAWIAPNGVFLCADQQFSSAVGMAEGELVGHTLASLVTHSEEVAALLDRCQAATSAELGAGGITAHLQFVHRYLDPVPMDLVVYMAGSDAQRILVLHCRRSDGMDGSLLAVDSHMRIRFASCEVSYLLGYPMRKLATMRLDQLLPPPYNALHARWLRDPPHEVRQGSCRTGAVVHLVSDMGALMPVRITIKTVDIETGGGSATVPVYAVQVAKVPADEVFREKRLVLSTDFTGRVLAVSPPDSSLFDFPAASLVGANLADSIDIFSDWRERSGDSQMQMILLALVGKEQEMPGTSWRVRIHEATTSDGGATTRPLRSTTNQGQPGARGPVRMSRSACLQVEVDEGATDESEEGVTRIQIKLWRRDLLSGVVELDEDLAIRKASPLTGLITGMPTAAMLKRPLRTYLNLPPSAATWNKLIHAAHGGSGSHKKSALKATTDRGTISPVMAFVGPHPDSGTMRLFVQGVQTLGPGGRPKVTLTLHPDTGFMGAHADIMRVLRLEGIEGDGADYEDVLGNLDEEDEDADGAATNGVSRATSAVPSTVRSKSAGRRTARLPQAQPPQGAISVDDGQGLENLSGSAHQRPGPSSTTAAGDEAGKDDTDKLESGESSEDDDGSGEADDEAAMHLHRQSSSKSEFVEQWVRSATNLLEHQQQQAAAQRRRTQEAAAEAEAAATGMDPAVTGAYQRGVSRMLGTVPEAGLLEDGGGGSVSPRVACMPPHREDGLRDRQVSRVLSLMAPVSGAPNRLASRDVRSPPEPGTGRSDAKARTGEDDNGGDNTGRDDKASENDASSVEDGSQAASGVSSASDATSATADVMVDARRGRLLKALNKVLLGSVLTSHMERLRLHSYVLICAMFIVHLVAYLIITSLVRQQHTNVYAVYRQAMAMDRSQMVCVRVLLGAFCARPGISPTGACVYDLNTTVTKLAVHINLFEEYHQAVYLGFETSNVHKPAQEVYKLWTTPWLNYSVPLDTTPPGSSEEVAGVWQLGNRYLAAARESLYFMSTMKFMYMAHRTFAFLLQTGIGPLFKGYSTSLDYLVNTAWLSIAQVEKDVMILLIVQAAAFQFVCTLYQAYLVHRAEQARLLGILAILGLPGPILRQLTNLETKVLHDSDDDTDDEGSTAGSDDRVRVSKNASGAAGKSAPAVAIKEQKGASFDDEREGRADKAGDATAVGSGAVAVVQASSGMSVDAADTAGVATGLAGRALTTMRARVSRKWRAPVSGPGSSSLNGAEHLKINGKTLLPSYWNVGKFVVPFLAWNIAVLILYGVTIKQLRGLETPLATLNMAAHVTYRYTRVRAFAAAFVTLDDPYIRIMIRGMLSSELDTFESEYNALMYGGLPSSMEGSLFQRTVPAGTFASSSFADIFFRTKQCLRDDQSACFKPGDEYYDVTHNGLDAMVRRMVLEMRLFSMDDNTDVKYDNPRYIFMESVGARDLYEGLNTASLMFVDFSIAQYDKISQGHTILLIVSIVLLLGFFLLLLWPHLAKMVRDAARQSALLSMVPPEMDVRGHVRAIYKKAAGRKKGAGKAAAPAGEAGLAVAGSSPSEGM